MINKNKKWDYDMITGILCYIDLQVKIKGFQKRNKFKLYLMNMHNISKGTACFSLEYQESDKKENINNFYTNLLRYISSEKIDITNMEQYPLIFTKNNNQMDVLNILKKDMSQIGLEFPKFKRTLTHGNLIFQVDNNSFREL